MTFIASVIAQKGVAIVADSLATSMEEVIEVADLYKFLTDKAEGEQLDPEQLFTLARVKPNFTKNYAEKLFQYDKFTAITTAGAGAINGKTIEALVHDLTIGVDQTISTFDIDEICGKFVSFVSAEANQHFNDRGVISATTFYITHYNPAHYETKVFKIDVPATRKQGDVKEITVEVTPIPDFHKVICDGQSATSNRILWGDIENFVSIGRRIIELVYEDLKQPVPDGYLNNFFNNADLLTDEMRESLKIMKLNNLSLQQAVDLAALLIKIEKDIQSFTENIPTVGGIIKMAVISNKGFEMILGDKIIIPLV